MKKSDLSYLWEECSIPPKNQIFRPWHKHRGSKGNPVERTKKFKCRPRVAFACSVWAHLKSCIHLVHSRGMDFARKQLEKYGWLEGEGLGKNRSGISKPLKPKLKFDNAGLGHDICEDFDNPWWQRLYNEAANNIAANEKNEKIVIELKGDPIDITIRKRKKRSSPDESKKYKGFIKTSELNGTEEKIYKDINTDYQREDGSTENEGETRIITNEELFKICGGRTVHKGARHGLKMSAKLARIMEQEKKQMVTTESTGSGDSNNSDTFKLKKKKKKNK